MFTRYDDALHAIDRIKKFLEKSYGPMSIFTANILILKS